MKSPSKVGTTLQYFYAIATSYTIPPTMLYDACGIV